MGAGWEWAGSTSDSTARSVDSLSVFEKICLETTVSPVRSHRSSTAVPYEPRASTRTSWYRLYSL